jgi:hypothetical protein
VTAVCVPNGSIVVVIHRPLSNLYVVYDDTRGTAGLLPPSRSLTVKVTQLFGF